jgi:hypothetical protein
VLNDGQYAIQTASLSCFPLFLLFFFEPYWGATPMIGFALLTITGTALPALAPPTDRVPSTGVLFAHRAFVC